MADEIPPFKLVRQLAIEMGCTSQTVRIYLYAGIDSGWLIEGTDVIRSRFSKRWMIFASGEEKILRRRAVSRRAKS